MSSPRGEDVGCLVEVVIPVVSGSWWSLTWLVLAGFAKVSTWWTDSRVSCGSTDVVCDEGARNSCLAAMEHSVCVLVRLVLRCYGVVAYFVG